MTVGADPYHNAFYPDQQTAYPVALFSLPEGSHLEIKGEFPHARSMTFSAYFYDPDSATLVGGDQQIVDYQIEPDEGSTNPFRDDADRTAKKRSYTLKWLPEKFPLKQKVAKKFPELAEKWKLEPNTLYLGEEEFPGIGYIVVMRIYVADQGTNLFGGTELPEATVVLADGSRITSDEFCNPDPDSEYAQYSYKFKGDMSSVYPSPSIRSSRLSEGTR